MASSQFRVSGRRVRAVRRRLGLGVIEFAQVCGVTRQTVHRWENDRGGIGGSSFQLIDMLSKLEAPK